MHMWDEGISIALEGGIEEKAMVAWNSKIEIYNLKGQLSFEDLVKSSKTTCLQTVFP